MLQMTPSRKPKDNPQDDREYWQIVYQTKNLCLYKEVLILIIKIEATELKMDD